MANYSISDTTLTALGDAVRKHAGETRKATVPLEAKDVNFSWDWNNQEDQEALMSAENTGMLITYEVDLSIDGATKYVVNYDYLVTGKVYYRVYNFNNHLMDYLDLAANGESSGTYTFNTDKIHMKIYYNSSSWGAPDSNINLNIIPYDGKGNEITTKEIDVKNTMTPMQMVEKINGLDGNVPEEALNITGDCQYRFAQDGWDWFINSYGNKITTSDIINASRMFYYATAIEAIPFEINLKKSSSYHDISYMFNGCTGLKEIPKINNGIPYTTNYFIYGCKLIRYLPEDIGEWFDWSYMEKQTGTYSCDKSNMFCACDSLRKVPMGLLNRANSFSVYSYSYFYNGFQACSSLDELVGLPIPYTAAWTSNAFSNTVNNCHRLKEFTFALQEDGTPYKVNWKSQKIDLGANRNIGFIPYESYKYKVLDYNSGITADKEVKDDATYQALKDDPDWFTCKSAYCRYNKQSAINTLNSLPDASEYLATAGGTNTIVLPSGCGGSTDGGNTSDLTEEEIAVATAKGWTVSFY